jgi:hypothetical protein
MLEQALGKKAKGAKFRERKFLGITNGGQFCYSVVDTDGGEGKVFLTYIHAEDQVIAVMG